MTASPLRVAFAGLAHSHPYTDAAGLRSRGAAVVAVHDRDPVAATEFAQRFDAMAVSQAEGLLAASPDLIVATPHPEDLLPTLRALGAAGARVPVFFNKTVSATPAQFHAFDAAVWESGLKVGTASVLRFAPALTALAEALRGEQVLAVRVHAQHDNAGFQLPGRDWQDDPALGGGTLVTVGVHAWELIERLLPGAVLRGGSGWVRRTEGSTTRSEDAAGLNGLLAVPDAPQPVPVQVLVSGMPGEDRYTVEVLTGSGVHHCALDVAQPLEALGFSGLVAALCEQVPAGDIPAPWTQARTVVENTVRAAGIARAAEGSTR